MTFVKDIRHKVEREAFSKLIDFFLANLDSPENRTETYLKIVDKAELFIGHDDITKEQFDQARAAFKDPNNRWVKFINTVVDETDPHVARMTLLNLGYEAFLRGTKTIRANREKYGFSSV